MTNSNQTPNITNLLQDNLEYVGITNPSIEALDHLDSDSNIISEILTESRLNCPYVTTSDFLTCIPSTNSASNLSVINFNVRSLNSNGIYLDALLESLNNSFDIIVLTESWTKQDTIDLSNI